MGKTQIGSGTGLPGGGGGKSIYTIQIPTFQISTTSTLGIALDGSDDANGAHYLMPMAGRVVKVSIGHVSTMGDGNVRLVKRAGGDGSGTSTPDEPFSTTSGGITIIEPADWTFIEDDGIHFEIVGDGFSATPINELSVTLAVEFDLV